MKLQELLRRIAVQRKEEFPFPENLESYLEDFTPNVLLKNETLQKAFQITAFEMEEIYAQGYGYYEENCYQEATTVFRWLLVFNPFIVKYWMGFGACLQMLGQYERALHSYAMASMLDPENSLPHLQAARCYQALNNAEEAEIALSYVNK